MRSRRIAVCLLLSPLSVCSILLAVPGARAQSVQTNDQLAALRTACADDAKKFCASVQPGGGRIVACLKEHQDSLSAACKKAAGLSAKEPATPSEKSSTPPSTLPGKFVAPKITPIPFKETFAERIIPDPAHGNMRAVTFHVPVNWQVKSNLEWHYNWVENPVAFSFQAENPDNAEAFFQYPNLRLEQVEFAARLKQYSAARMQYKPGDRMPLGAIYYPPLPPLQGLATFIRMVRPNVTNLKWMGTQELPDMAKVLSLPPWPGDHGLAIKISYDLDGKPVEEAFFGVYYMAQVSNPAMSAGSARIYAGEMKQTNWGFRALRSFRAPAGTLEKRIPVFCFITKSAFINPQWGRLLNAIGDQILKDFNAKLKQGFDEIRAADAILQQTISQEKAFQTQFDKMEAQYRESNLSSGSSRSGGKHDAEADSYLPDGGKRSAFDHFDDLIVGVDTMLDPENGNETIKLSNAGQYHFTNGLGDYFTTDDPNLTPEKAGRSGTWTAMTEAP